MTRTVQHSWRHLTDLADLSKWVADRLNLYSKIGLSPVCIAIDGRSGSGKSTIAASLADRFGAALISGDDFFAGPTDVVAQDAEALADSCIDRQKLRRVLIDLKSGRSARYRPFDWKKFDGSLEESEVKVSPEPAVIFEGVYMAHPELRDCANLSILVDAPRNVRERRLIEREGEIGDWERQWHRAEDWYFERLAHAFDVQFHNDRF